MRTRWAYWLVALTGLLAIVTAAAVTVAGEASGGKQGGSAAPGKLAVHDAPRELPDVGFAGPDGEPKTLADFRGQVVVLNLWATWCPPCREEMPTLDALQAKLGGKDFQVVALSVDQGGPSVVRDFYDAVGVKHLAPYIDSTMGAMADLRVRGIPTTLVIDRQGREVARLTGKADWSTARMVRYLRGLVDQGGNGTVTAAGSRGGGQ